MNTSTLSPTGWTALAITLEGSLATLSLIGRDALPALKVIYIAWMADPIGFRHAGIKSWTLLVNAMNYYFKLTGRGVCAYLHYGDINPASPRKNGI